MSNVSSQDEGRFEAGRTTNQQSPATTGAAGADDLSALFNYPSLGQLFDERTGETALAAMRTRLASTITNLERVVRQGSKEDAERAMRIIRAYNTTLEFLTELERLRDGGAQGRQGTQGVHGTRR